MGPFEQTFAAMLECLLRAAMLESRAELTFLNLDGAWGCLGTLGLLPEVFHISPKGPISYVFGHSNTFRA